MIKPKRYDWFVYKLFYRRWNRIFNQNPVLYAAMFEEMSQAYAYFRSRQSPTTLAVLEDVHEDVRKRWEINRELQVINSIQNNPPHIEDYI